jgi:hypothetical protein
MFDYANIFLMSLKKNGFHQTLMILLRCFWNFRLIAFCHNVNEKWLPQLECWTAVIDRYLLMNDQDWATVNRISTYIFSHWSLVVAVGDCHGLVVEFTYMLLAYHHWIVSWSPVHGGGFLMIFRISPPIKLTATI